MFVRLFASQILRKTQKAAQVLLPDNRTIWFPTGQCPGLEKLGLGDQGPFACPQWLAQREGLQHAIVAPSRVVEVHGQVLLCTDEAAFVRLMGSEEVWLPFAQCPGLAALPIHGIGAFLCPAGLLTEKELQHYALSAPELIEELRKGNLSLKQAIYSPQLPPKTLHNFAYLCAQKVLLQEAEQQEALQQEEPPLSWWRAMKVKRRWIDEEVDDETLHQTREALSATWGCVDGQHKGAIAAVLSSLDTNPYAAAHNTARCLAFGFLDPSLNVLELSVGVEQPETNPLIQARTWQSNTLAELIAMTLQTRSQTKSEQSTQERQNAAV